MVLFEAAGDAADEAEPRGGGQRRGDPASGGLSEARGRGGAVVCGVRVNKKQKIVVIVAVAVFAISLICPALD